MPDKLIWTDEMISTLHSLRQQGYNLQHCADKIGVCYNVTWRKAQELGISRPLQCGCWTGLQMMSVTKPSYKKKSFYHYRRRVEKREERVAQN